MKYESDGPVLERSTVGSAGFDLHSFKIIKHINDVYYYSTGIRVEIPHGYVGDVHERSSLHKKGYSLVNSVGVIDSDYRGDIIVALRKNDDAHELSPECRVAQLVVKKCYEREPEMVTSISATIRGDGGFGSTGS
jgi:dUTP pyrophosphatase